MAIFKVYGLLIVLIIIFRIKMKNSNLKKMFVNQLIYLIKYEKAIESDNIEYNEDIKEYLDWLGE